MEAEGMSHVVAASIAANGTIEAARITASATIDASRNTLIAALVAVFAALSAIAAAYINTWHARRTYRTERDAYRHLIGGTLASFRSELALERFRASHLLKALREGTPMVFVFTNKSLPPELRDDQWKQHAILGPAFARKVVTLRKFYHYRAQTGEKHEWEWDLSVDHDDFESTDSQLDGHIETLDNLISTLDVLNSCTKTVWEKTINSGARVFRAMRWRMKRRWPGSPERSDVL